MGIKKVMVCDDDRGILDLIELIMEDAGFSVISEINSLNAISRIEKEKPDLLILDIWMPVLSGDQVLKSIKDSSSIVNLPVIMYSASTEGEVIAKAAGADDYIAKPFDLDELIGKVNKWMV
ncbi:response regulator [Pedobacter sp. KBW06]|uniref:response regulator n=1 Tax=Pedobacter sp. KBW06 TaxID=2153359 RepID=UPI000F5AF85A|nr:response regulator [Pedobacter sp. KBW06]RQO69422.1 response regulator [Pedobacter sp. KBW06]